MILVTGANGQLGFDVLRELRNRKIECVGAARSDFDITSYNEVEEFILKMKPECIIHCAAYTAVDKAEDEKDMCNNVNVFGTENIAKACKKIDSKMIYVSSDYIFDGSGVEPHEIYEKPNPLSFYGKSKYGGELKVKEYLAKYFIVRTSWVFGINGMNFVKTIIKLGEERDDINVVCDQVGSPTYTVDLANLLCDMVESEAYGIYHATNEGFCSWAEFAQKIIWQLNKCCKINYIPTIEYKSKAIRPINSMLSKKSLIDNGFSLLPEWENALERYLKELEEN